MRALLVTLLLPAVFAPRAGWHTGHGHVHACPGVPASRCVHVTSWAATIPWRGCRYCIPHQVIERLPGDGVVLQVTVSVEHPIATGRALSWPPTIHPREVAGGFEGIPGRYGVYQTSARFDGVEADVWAFFGRRHPTRAQLARANAELRTVRLPR